LVLGACASSDYGFPLGRGLRDLFCENKGEWVIHEAGYDRHDLAAFVDALAHSGYPSVDWFLEDHPEFKKLAKQQLPRRLYRVK